MLLDQSEQFVISSVGWVDKGSLVRRTVATGGLETYPLSGLDFAGLRDIDGDRFLVIGHSRESFCLSVRRFEQPSAELWSLRVSQTRQTTSGAANYAQGVGRYHVWFYCSSLVVISEDYSSASFLNLPWYNGDNYDLGYEGLVEAAKSPVSELVLVSVQRAGHVVIVDPTDGRQVEVLTLAGRGGNPPLHFVGAELWSIDYDTFVIVDLEASVLKYSKLVQPGGWGMSQRPAGDLFIDKWMRAVIPRPDSHDAVVIDPVSGKKVAACRLGKKPLSCIATSSGIVIARDWQTGSWLSGTLS